jgi:hypothetical protein
VLRAARAAPAAVVAHLERWAKMTLRIISMAVLVVLSGCLAIPHLDQLSPQIAGSVVDSSTRAPLKDVRVEFVEYPSMAVVTDEKGSFFMRETKKPELFVPLGQSEGFNIGSRVAPRLRVIREGYVTLEVDASRPESWDDSGQPFTPATAPSYRGPFSLRPIALERAN